MPPADPKSDRTSAPFTPAWTADPVVAVSKRMRVLEFPSVLLQRDATPAECDAWRLGPQQQMDVIRTHRVTLMAGVTVLGAVTTSWALLDVPSRERAPRQAPPLDACRIVMPMTTAHNLVNDGAQFKATGADGQPDYEYVDPAKVSAAWERVLAYLRRQEEALRASGMHLPAPLFWTQRGFDAPELTVGRLSDFLTQREDTHRAAYPFITAGIKGVRDGLHLGAFHDYCARSDRGWNLAMECRAVLSSRPGLVAR